MAGSSLFPDQLQGLRGGDDRDVLVCLEYQQVLIAGDDEVGVGGEGGGEYLVVIRITAHRLRQGRGFNHGGQLAQRIEQVAA